MPALNLRGTTGRDWATAVGLGAVLGALVLGGGGRAAMRVIAVSQGTPGAFSLGGTMTVVVLGAASGAVGGAILVVSRWLFPARRWARVSLFWLALLLLTLRGLRPLDPLRAKLFVPLVVLYGAALYAVWAAARTPRGNGGT
jgi:hypothetical protein